MRKLYFVALLLASVSAVSRASERTLWLYEQLSNSPLATNLGESRYQVGLSAVQFYDAISSQLHANLDARLFELSGSYAKRTYFQSRIPGLEQSYLVEMARYFSTAQRHFGRLGAGFFRFPDQATDGLRLSLTTGILPNQEIPWEFILRLAVFFSFQNPDKIISAQLQMSKVWGESRIGGLAGWSHRPRSNLGLGVYEYMLISTGPYWDISLGPSRLQLSALWRVWLDQEYFIQRGQTTEANPNEFRGFPDLALAWTFCF